MSIATEIQRLQTAKADLKTAIEAKGVTIDENATIDTYASKVGEIQSGGGGVPDDMKWANHTETVTIRDLNWGTETTVLNFPNVKSQNFGLTVRNTTVKHLIINYGVPLTTLDRGFYWGSDGGVLEHLTLNGDLSQVTSYRQMFSTNPNLRILDGTPLDFSSSTNNGAIFGTSSLLEYLRIVPYSIKVSANFSGCRDLTDDSVQSIIDGLADLTGTTAQTLTVRAQVKSRIEANSVWLASITGKNWTLA